MFKKILLPTDGTELSRKAIIMGIEYAKSLGAAVVGFHAMRDIIIPGYDLDIYAAKLDLYGNKELMEMAHRTARNYLAYIADMAREKGVPCETFYAMSNTPYEAIIDAAKQWNCDLIFMASHGYKGISALLLGSETQKVLAHTSIPVLVYRDSVKVAPARDQ